MSEWKEYRLEDFASFKYGKLPPKGVVANGYPIWSGYKYVGTAETYNCPKNTPIVVARGVGGTGDVKIAKEDCFLTNLSILVSLNERICNPHFFTYYFAKDNLRYLDSGSAQSQITIEALKGVVLKLPPLSEQKKIAAVLSSLDEKIETNRKINARLEELAQALFKSWFIDFEPFGGKMPEDWKNTKVCEVSVINEKQYSLKENWSSFKYLDTGNITENTIGELQQFSNQSELPSRARRKVKDYDIIYSTVRPNQRHLGILLNPGKNWLISTGFTVISAKKYCVNPFYLYMVVSQKTISDYLQTIGEQATSAYPSVNASDIGNLNIIVPNLELQNQFGTVISQLYQQKYNLEKESAQLAELRDALLPKLMSGELKPK